MPQLRCSLLYVAILAALLLAACSSGDVEEDEDFEDGGATPKTVASRREWPEPPAEPVLADRLPRVRHWLYLIDVNLDDETVGQIAESEHDLVVLDFIPSEAQNTDYLMAAVIERLHASREGRLVVAYVDIGQAESYRTYWGERWEVGDPDWIVGADPDGWAENFPVAFWRGEWREIWLGDGGYLEGILGLGFDGVYLDWVEAYSDDHVLEVAARDGVDAREEMIRWVGDIAAFARERRTGFIVIAQNAAELAEDDGYLGIIDAIAQEQVWFDGGADNLPPGDCPLPRTTAEIDTDEYYDSLSADCRRQFDEFPDSTLHVSSEEYLLDLALARSKGVTILTVDYALEAENIAWVFETSRALGFIPVVSNRSLDQFVEPVP